MNKRDKRKIQLLREREYLLNALNMVRSEMLTGYATFSYFRMEELIRDAQNLRKMIYEVELKLVK
jgi:hypothetical protein